MKKWPDEEFDFSVPPAVYDVCSNRHKGNKESQAAFAKIKDRLTGMQLVVLDLIRESGDRGMTCDEISAKMGRGENCYSGRISELKRLGKIKKNGTRLTRG